jgi:uncharacterized RDD family membrane protein YckC
MQNPPPPPPPPMTPPSPGGYPPPPPAAAPVQAGYGYAPQVTYGGFWIRFVAYIIDAILLGIPLGFIGGIIGGVAGVALSNSSNSSSTNGLAAATTGILGLYELFAFAVTIVYFVYFWSSGSTIGMRVFKLRVVDATTGQPIGLGRAILRYVGFWISCVVCYIGLIWAGFDARKQGWHDKIATTVVLQG